ncbi:hypothetical protein FACS1894151_07960 [Spirochaetia bacterium]|nr:hypothetical protein FACS1894151_07960 [Spirochaetia bacterium]
MQTKVVGSNQIQVIKGDQILYKMDNGGVYLNTGSALGYYEIPFSYFDDTLTIQLKAYSGSYVNFPSFTMERGKKYSFIYNGTSVVKTGEQAITFH